MVLFHVALKRDSVSLKRFPFQSHVQTFLCEISLICPLKYPNSSFFFPIFVSLVLLFCLSLCCHCCYTIAMIWLCVKRTWMSIKIERRNLEIRKKRNDFSVQVRTFLLPLSLKVLRHKERGTIFLFWLFHLPPPQHVWHPPQRSPRASESQSSRSVSSSQLTDFFQISQNPLRASGAWRHSHSLASVSHLGLLWYLWVTHPLCARTWSPALMLHLSNPCTKPKGSQPN